MRVEVACALPDRQVLLELDVAEGATAREVIDRSGILRRFPAVKVVAGQVGIFGRVVDLDAPVREGDRVEIYRALIATPREARRARAKSTRKAPG